MAQPSRALLITIRIIDTFTDLTGTIFRLAGASRWWAAVAYEVVARYLFNAPTIWSFDLTYMLYGALFMLGAAYALHKGAHIRTDFFWDNFSPRTKGLIDSISYVVFFFPSFTASSASSATTRPTTPSRSTRPPTRRRGGRSCGRSSTSCPSPAFSCSSRASRSS